ncbi:hydroxyethylthiazole kinase [Alkalihalobacillus pseudalcaliphilus]|uniref:hydroxyethylthiazole kinase n=1 Tax=Alkalihalobacillus pseudalcaliphilus TaxID=79884 RepID=UPI00064DD21D|nr:hydroxyethylthiazole kinase [Alkalihalobacillus pseudalcaliphilus]KMK77689.1 hydroxyethylthiazole kinase [Alkalihalobacillus pseudalcaliphilus]
MYIERIRQEQPLIHSMTNVVVTNFTANGLLAIGASPVMAYAKEEVADMAKVAGAVLLNIGTLSEEQVEAMILAGKSANKHGVPVVLDPVGAGATTLRTESAKRILEEVQVTVLRGNAGEISSLVGQDVQVKGVDGAVNGEFDQLASEASRLFRCLTVVTGEVDYVSDGHSKNFKLKNGHSWLTKVVGTGCLLGAYIASFLAVAKEEEFIEAIVDGIASFNIASEKAYQETKEKGIGSFQTEFLNQLFTISDQDVLVLKKVEEAKGWTE